MFEISNSRTVVLLAFKRWGEKKSNSGQQKVQRLVSVHRVDSSDVIATWRNWVGPFCSTASCAWTPLAPPMYLWDGCLPVRYFVGRTEYSWARLSPPPNKTPLPPHFLELCPLPITKTITSKEQITNDRPDGTPGYNPGTSSHSFPWSVPVFSKGRGCRKSKFW